MSTKKIKCSVDSLLNAPDDTIIIISSFCNDLTKMNLCGTCYRLLLLLFPSIQIDDTKCRMIIDFITDGKKYMKYYHDLYFKFWNAYHIFDKSIKTIKESMINLARRGYSECMTLVKSCVIDKKILDKFEYFNNKMYIHPSVYRCIRNLNLSLTLDKYDDKTKHDVNKILGLDLNNLRDIVNDVRSFIIMTDSRFYDVTKLYTYILAINKNTTSINKNTTSINGSYIYNSNQKNDGTWGYNDDIYNDDIYKGDDIYSIVSEFAKFCLQYTWIEDVLEKKFTDHYACAGIRNGKKFVEIYIKPRNKL